MDEGLTLSEQLNKERLRRVIANSQNIEQLREAALYLLTLAFNQKATLRWLATYPSSNK